MRSWFVVVLLGGCSAILGLSAPKEQADATADGGAFTFAINPLSVTVPQGGMNFVDVTVTRVAGYTDTIIVTADAPPPGLQLTPLTLGPTDATGHVVVTATSQLALGTQFDLVLDAVGGSGATAITRMAMVPATVTGEPGTIDPTFNATGVVKLTGSRGAEAQRVLVGSDGKAFGAGGTFGLAGPFPLVARVLDDGTFDTGFASVGHEQLNVNQPGKGTTDSEPFAIGRQLGGNTILACNDHLDTGTGTNDVQIVSVLPDGTLDPNFGDLQVSGPNHVGYLTLDLAIDSDDSVSALAVDATDNIVFGGTINGFLYLGRVGPTGEALDTSFGSNGLIQPTQGDGTIATIAIDANANIVVAGAQPVTNNQTLVFRLKPDGKKDPGFNGGTPLVLGNGFDEESAAALFIQGDGKMIVLGSTNLATGTEIVIRRLLPSGLLDTSFGTGGKVIYTATDGDNQVAGAVQLADGRIVIGLNVQSGTTPGPALARILPDGTPDPTFGTNGVAPIFFGNGGVLNGLSVTPDQQKIVVAGKRAGTFDEYVLARFWN